MCNHHSLTTTSSRLLLATAAWLIGTAAVASGSPAGPPSGGVLQLTNGGFVSGELKDSDRPGHFRWQSPSFVDPFLFATSGINAAHWPPPEKWPAPSGDYSFELAGGDIVFGSLLDLDEEGAQIETARLGRIHLPRAGILRIYRWRGGADLIYSGPNGLTGWYEPLREIASPERAGQPQRARRPPARRTFQVPPEPSAPKEWREESGQLLTDREGASIRGDFGIPVRAALEFEVSWKGKPDFVLAFGVDDDSQTVDRAFRFEVWEGQLVAHRETEQEADVSPVQPLASGPGRAHILAYLDQDAGRMLVFSPGGKPLADLKVAGRKTPAKGGVYLANIRGDVRLERLRIGRWNGEVPREAEADRSRIHRADGSIVYGKVTRFDAASEEFVVVGEAGESRIAEDQVAGVFLSPSGDGPTRAIRAVYQDGSRLSGELIRVKEGELWLSMPGVAEPLRLPVAGLRSLVVLRHEATPTAIGGPSGILEMEGVRLPGRLADRRERPESSCLAWQPQGSDTANPLRPGASGRIIYKEPPPPTPAPALQPRRRARLGVVNGVLRALAGDQPSRPAGAGGRRSLHLRTGDVIPSEVTKIDEEGVTFRTSLSESTFVSHDKVKAVELAPATTTTVKLDKSKRERLLTLPRMQKESPPAHLIRSKNGDYLRGRVANMDDKTLQVEVRLETKDVPRDRISRIIWLHADEIDPSKGPARPLAKDAATRVQALRSDGIRLTFLAERVEDATLSGKSDVLGACRVRLDEVDQLLIGGAIEKAAAQLAYQQWKLQNAAEPKVAQGDGGPSPTGTESALVGKPAPDFELELLGGEKFRLARSKGKVVVLDFWATWCGPCLQAMPQVDRVTHELKDRGVELVAVNLQEAPAQISAMLQRHKLQMTVALDRDGTVAEKYGATAIPQTVIIDRDGTIARLFIGGGPQFEGQLREALLAILPGGDPKGTGKE